jgi:hypothetical protein
MCVADSGFIYVTGSLETIWINVVNFCHVLRSIIQTEIGLVFYQFLGATFQIINIIVV